MVSEEETTTKFADNVGDDVEFSWTERVEENDARVGQMYCFKNCSVNKN